MAKKRSNDGKEKSSAPLTTARRRQTRLQEATNLNDTPPGAQIPVLPSRTNETRASEENAPVSKKQKRDNTTNVPTKAASPNRQPAKTSQAPPRLKRAKLPKLPAHATLTKRPLHHPAPPNPFTSAAQPKTIYLTTTSPFIPALKRIRALLAEISKRHKQSLSAHNQQHPRSRQLPRRSKPVEADGKLKAVDLEREMALEVAEKADVGAEEVFVRATGRAIERALQIGVHFQGEDDCRVRVEMGSVQAVDDVSVGRRKGRGMDQAQDVEMVDADGEQEVNGKKKKAKEVKDEDIPETRIRTLSSIMVAIGLK